MSLIVLKMAKWYSTEESVIQGIEIVATNFCESPYFKVLLDKIRTHPGQSEFKDQFISTAVEWGKAKYVEAKSAEQAIKYAMLYIAYIIAENDLAVLNAKAHPNEGVGDASLDDASLDDASLDDILNDACGNCEVKLNFRKLQESLLRIVNFVSKTSIEIYNAGKEPRRLAAVEARAEAKKERAEAEQAITDAKIREQIAEGETNAELVRSSSVEKLASFMPKWEGVLPSVREEDMPTKILPKTNPHKIRVVRFVQMLLFILEAKKAQIKTLKDLEEFFKTLFIAWLKGKNVSGYDAFTFWMATTYRTIDLKKLESLKIYHYLKEWDKKVRADIREEQIFDLEKSDMAVYKCPAWLLVNHITFDQVLFALSQTNIYNESPLLTRDGNTIVWSKKNFNSFEKFNFEEDKSVVLERRRRNLKSDDDD